jgi:hypothetical protein
VVTKQKRRVDRKKINKYKKRSKKKNPHRQPLRTGHKHTPSPTFPNFYSYAPFGGPPLTTLPDTFLTPPATVPRLGLLLTFAFIPLPLRSLTLLSAVLGGVTIWLTVVVVVVVKLTLLFPAGLRDVVRRCRRRRYSSSLMVVALPSIGSAGSASIILTADFFLRIGDALTSFSAS